ncbi:MAG: YtxH domain-containing protein [Armatimonadia bacterium]
MDKKTFIEGIAVGAVAGAIAGLLLAPKTGQKMRDEIKAHFAEIKDQIVAKLEAADDFTQTKYEEVVKAVIAELEAAKKITGDEAQEMASRLQDGYEAVKQTIHEHTAGDESPTTA